MNFLEARRVLASFQGGDTLSFLLGMSGTTDTLDIYLRATAASRGRAADPRTLPFNTLAQALLTPAREGEREVFVLLPWDLLPIADWRSGLPVSSHSEAELNESARVVAERFRSRRNARLLFVPAPLPPLTANPAGNQSLESRLLSIAQSLGARVLPAEVFSLSTYLSTGAPFAGRHLGAVATEIIDCALGETRETAKVLVTDLDNVMWYGVIGEDGLDGIRFAPEGLGYRFFLYQSLLAKLKNDGALLAAVSRNDPELALAPFRAREMTLREEDFVTVVASYSAKSAQISSIAERLNLGLESFVFVDDNPVELAEVGIVLPSVECVRFPATDEELPPFFGRLSGLFARTSITAEDRQRTEMYRRRLEGMVPSDAEGADLSAFLRELDMKLVIHDRSGGGRARAVQLINKTNQFNLNGRRWTDDEVEAVIAGGGRLYSATLNDRNGTHGEILACLISPDRVVESLVMSCRVFQRRVEYAFLTWLAAREDVPHALAFSETARNEPIRQFLRHPAMAKSAESRVRFDSERFAAEHANDLSLFRVADEVEGGVAC